MGKLLIPARSATGKSLASGGLSGLHPVKRLGRPDEVGDRVAYRASARASLVTGAYCSVDGGYMAQ